MTNVFIYGSCVSRDVVRVAAEKHNLVATDYHARSSWVSKFSPPTQLPNVASALTSPFQQRMVNNDFQSIKFDETPMTSSDIVLLDLIDERYGVFVSPNGYITSSTELYNSQWLKHMYHGDLIQFGTRTHFELFKKASLDLLTHLNGAKTLLIKSDFASKTDLDESVPYVLGRSAEEWADIYQPYYEHLSQLGMTILDVPSELCLATKNHLWGLAPFHYIDAFYLWVASHIAKQPKLTAK
ncbi:hypothetical protein JOD55_000435 [Arcanobacterium pluranimalium]|uniref:DUF6270 domain-containing protein n=1 Tax=Arcanobacterium pluranimalium TaxID=108028 RepID=UPI00195DE0D2|nr:DUF6270 domain-containing protein [Arcanobacterium pluranimalium]MBM7824608.1 hypothetical protein [Arcanobacterium pluranimalium]